LDNIHNHDEAWFISSGKQPEDSSRWVSEIKKFHESGKGLAIFADNDPFYVHANLILKDILGTTLQGSTPGNKILKVGDGAKAGQFARHLLTTGIVNLHEGNTICFPTKNSNKFKVIGTSTDGNPCMFYCDPAKGFGPIVVDCGFTKLYAHHWKETAGTERYVRNIAVWLLSLDYRMKIGAPWKGPITEESVASNTASEKTEK